MFVMLDLTVLFFVLLRYGGGEDHSRCGGEEDCSTCHDTSIW